jgi:pseudouridine-5'-phosphate glycosidase
MSVPTPIRLADEVRAALADGRGVVALESVIVAHGLPRPANLEVACEMEAAVRAAGAVPAVIALLDGELCVGLARTELRRLAETRDAAKAGHRDLPALVLRRATAATTVGATLFLARRAGIDVVATGGIGGVHRDFAQSGDVSADLTALAQCGGLVVCSGAKSILDLPRTLELLETLGVPVVGYQTREMPAFYVRSSDLGLDHAVQTPHDAAQLIRAARAIGLPATTLLVQPVPAEFAIDRRVLDRWLQDATREATARGISGQEVTPYLLDRLHVLSAGDTLAANRALACSNAALAGQVACSLATYSSLANAASRVVGE